MKIINIFVSVVISSILVACGGGSGARDSSGSQSLIPSSSAGNSNFGQQSSSEASPAPALAEEPNEEVAVSPAEVVTGAAPEQPPTEVVVTPAPEVLPEEQVVVAPTPEPAPEPVPESTPQTKPVAAVVEWDIPLTRANGDDLLLSEIGGYEIIYRNLDDEILYTTVVIEDGTIGEYLVENLTPGEYEVMIAAYDTEGLYSDYSDPAIATIGF